jgi:hypothetical protein
MFHYLLDDSPLGSPSASGPWARCPGQSQASFPCCGFECRPSADPRFKQAHARRCCPVRTFLYQRLQGYVTNLRACPDGTPVTAEFVIGAYHRLFDLQARPVYHRIRDSIEAHLTIVFAALAVSRWIERQTGWSICKFVKTAQLPHHPDPGWTPRHHRRRPFPRRTPASLLLNQPPISCALSCHNSGCMVMIRTWPSSRDRRQDQACQDQRRGCPEGITCDAQRPRR